MRTFINTKDEKLVVATHVIGGLILVIGALAPSTIISIIGIGIGLAPLSSRIKNIILNK